MNLAILERVILIGVPVDVRELLLATLQERSAIVVFECAEGREALAFANSSLDRKHLFIIGNARTEHVALLTKSLPKQPVFALISPGNELATAFALKRAGAAQVLAHPLDPSELRNALDVIAEQFMPLVSESKVIAVCGASGGAGTTTLALELSRELASIQTQTGQIGCLLIELSNRLGGLATLLDIEPSTTTFDLLHDPASLTPSKVRRAMTSIDEGLNVLVAPYREIVPESPSANSVTQLVDQTRGIASVVVIDLPCTFDAVFFETLARVDRVVLVGVQRVASLRTMKLIREILVREEGQPEPLLVVNRYEPTIPGLEIPRISQLLRSPPPLTIADDFPSLMAAAKHGRSLRDAASGSPILADVHRLKSLLLSDGSRLPSSKNPVYSQPASSGPRRLRVLHIEDDAVHQDLVRLHLARLARWYFDITLAVSETDSVTRFSPGLFDFVILDYHLCEGDGLSTLQRLRAMDDVVPILVLSGLSEPNVAAELLEAGADDFLSKENLTSERLERSIGWALSRADGLRARRPLNRESELTTRKEGIETFRAEEVGKLIERIRQAAKSVPLTLAHLQRLADRVSDELEQAGDNSISRQMLMELFLRLFT
ncbi:MAG: response regulator [Planctomycetia bacterium]|nr:response regulator [Planctomycetia bacterium]